jgi:hypothetical protein
MKKNGLLVIEFCRHRMVAIKFSGHSNEVIELDRQQPWFDNLIWLPTSKVL